MMVNLTTCFMNGRSCIYGYFWKQGKNDVEISFFVLETRRKRFTGWTLSGKSFDRGDILESFGYDGNRESWRQSGTYDGTK